MSDQTLKGTQAYRWLVGAGLAATIALRIDAVFRLAATK